MGVKLDTMTTSLIVCFFLSEQVSALNLGPSLSIIPLHAWHHKVRGAGQRCPWQGREGRIDGLSRGL